jgi:hypothetical protein
MMTPPEGAPDEGAPTIADAGSPPDEASSGDDASPGVGADAGETPPAEAGPADAVSPPLDASSVPLNKHAVLIWGYGEHWPSPMPNQTPEPFDVTMKNLLEAKGLVVDLMVDKDSTVAAVQGKALFIISNSVNRANLFDNGQPRFKNIAVPGLVTKDGPIEVMGMGAGGAGGFSTGVGETTINIVAPSTEPLTAGLTGMVRVYSPITEPCPACGVNMSCCWNQMTKSTEPGDRIIYAFPGPNAHKIATIVGAPTQWCIFAYDKGAMMVGGFPAPAKRVGFFIHRDADYSDDGKKLFNAAVDYMLAP